MKSDEFEQAFSQFLERPEYDEAEQALFDIIREAFLAGWRAARGDPLPAQNVVYLLRKKQPEEGSEE